MTTAADDSAVEDAFEALLAGRPAPEGQAGLAAFTEAVRASATRPGRPHAALAELLATGLLADQSSPSVRTARPAGGPPARAARVRTRRGTAMILPVLLAKFLSAGAVAQAATGAGVVLVAVTGVGAVGALPPTAQDTFATVVAAATPLEAPTSAGQTDAAAEQAGAAAAEQTVDGDAETDEADKEASGIADEDPAAVQARVEEWILNGPDENEPFGAWVSEGSKDDVKDWLRANDMTFGDVVSAWAHGDGLSAEQLTELGLGEDAGVAEPQAPALVEDAPSAVVADAGSFGSSGEAQGQGQTKAQGQAKAQTKAQPQDQAKSHKPAQGNGRGNG